MFYDLVTNKVIDNSDERRYVTVPKNLPLNWQDLVLRIGIKQRDAGESASPEAAGGNLPLTDTFYECREGVIHTTDNFSFLATLIPNIRKKDRESGETEFIAIPFLTNQKRRGQKMSKAGIGIGNPDSGSSVTR